MKKLLIGLMLAFAAQGSSLLSHDNIKAFFSDNSKIKQICLNNRKALILWKGAIESSCDCLDKNLGLFDKEFTTFMQANKENVSENDVKVAGTEIATKLVINKDFTSDNKVIDKLLGSQSHLLEQECDEYLVAMTKAHNSAFDKAKEHITCIQANKENVAESNVQITDDYLENNLLAKECNKEYLLGMKKVRNFSFDKPIEILKK